MHRSTQHDEGDERDGRPGPMAEGRDSAPLRSRYVVAVLLVLAALVSVVMWGMLANWSTEETAKSLDRDQVPGSLTIDLHPGTWNVYAEGPVEVGQVTVAYPDGRSVDVTMTDGGATAYSIHGLSAARVATFELPRGGEWPDMQIRVEGSSQDPDGGFAVAASDRFSYVKAQRWGMLGLMVVNVGAALAIVVVPLVRFRRRARRSAGDPGDG